ncbi:hypothetical protein [Actinomadura sp. WMMB 499]|nr:hypothetical protein [Actinomadura sp. WMMB 499]
MIWANRTFGVSASTSLPPRHVGTNAHQRRVCRPHQQWTPGNSISM